MTVTDTFINRCIMGTAKPNQVDDFIDQWHAGAIGQGLELREMLGLDKPEYVRFMRSGSAIETIVTERQAALHFAGALPLPLRKFESIDQFRHVVANIRHQAEYIGQDAEQQPIYDASRPKPVITFHGTVKLHGTNCGVAFDLVNDKVTAQSKDRMLSIEHDNFQFCAWLESEKGAADLEQLMRIIAQTDEIFSIKPVAACRVFGEWCGPLVNGKTAIGQLSLRWVVFKVLVSFANGQEMWLPLERIATEWAMHRGGVPSLIHFITDYPQWSVAVDFNAPEDSLDELERVTLAVEAECPVAKALGGNGIGEGVVWACQDATYGHHTFKVKGTKHKGTKNSRLVQIEPEVLASMDAFVDAVVTDSRLEQGFELIRAEHGKVTEDHIGRFLQWMGQDVLKEEVDTLEASGLERKQVMSRVNHRAKAWLMPRLARV